MMDEIKKLLEVETARLGGAGEHFHKARDAIQSLQRSLPDDLKERREAAAEFLNRFAYDIDFKKGTPKEDLLKEFLIHCYDDNGCEKEGACAVIHTCADSNDPKWCAWKRLLGIHTGDFSAESEYYDPSPDYPEQWLDHMSEESAEWLIEWLEEHQFDMVEHPQKSRPPTFLLRYHYFVWCSEGHETIAHVCKAPFLTGGLELPRFIDEEEL